MSNKQNDNIVEFLQEKLIQAIESGDKKLEEELRNTLKNIGLLSAEEVEELNNYI